MHYNFWDIFQNKIIGLSVASCLIAQFLKVVVYRIQYKKFDFAKFAETGGMPSSHSSFVATLSTCVGLLRGFDSVEFAMCFVFSLIIMYDASGVRKSVGEQAKIINKIILKLEKNDQNVGEEIKELMGHTKPQVLIGALLGILIGLIYIYI